MPILFREGNRVKYIPRRIIIRLTDSRILYLNNSFTDVSGKFNAAVVSRLYSCISIKLHLCVFVYGNPHNTTVMTCFPFVIHFTFAGFLGNIKLNIL